MKKTSSKTAVNKSIKFITILFRGTCPKLTARGKGDLSYELGIDEDTADSYVRISGNDSSGAYSNEWLDIGKIRTLLTTQEKPFPAIVMEGLFHGRSTNNHGYLAAILIAEKVLVILPGKPIMLSIGDWEPVLIKIKTLKDKMVSLTDHIAIAIKKKAEKKAELIAKMRSAKGNTKMEPAEPTPAES
jgi:hypothetical protein